MNLSYEAKMHMLNQCRPEKKDILLLKLLRGESIDVTKDEDLFFLVNKDRMNVNDYTDRDKFKIDAKNFKAVKEGAHDVDGKTQGKTMRWLGDLPEEIYFTNPAFSPLLPKEERDRNIKKWLNDHPVFRVGDKRL